jgi:hypothetical protein
MIMSPLDVFKAIFIVTVSLEAAEDSEIQRAIKLMISTLINLRSFIRTNSLMERREAAF